MSWAEWKIQQYNQGKKANWLERHCLDHANPVNFGLTILGLVPLYYGLWMHKGEFVFLGIVLHGLGHLYSSLIK